MGIGRDDRWWNRKIRFPAKKILLVTGLIVVVGLGYLWFGSVIESCLWSITHRSTATYAGWPGTKYVGFSVKVPWMWRQEPSLGSEQDIEIVHARVGALPLERIWIRHDASPGDARKEMESMRRFFGDRMTKAGYPNARMDAFPLDPDLASHFTCMAMSISGSATAGMVQCGSNDGGRWLVRYSRFGARNADGLHAVLRKLVSQN